jgi:hypothetical protein
MTPRDDTDGSLWTQAQAACLAARDVEALDGEPLGEAMTSLGSSAQPTLGSHPAAAVRLRWFTGQ